MKLSGVGVLLQGAIDPVLQFGALRRGSIKTCELVTIPINNEGGCSLDHKASGKALFGVYIDLYDF